MKFQIVHAMRREPSASDDGKVQWRRGKQISPILSVLEIVDRFIIPRYGPLVQQYESHTVHRNAAFVVVAARL